MIYLTLQLPYKLPHYIHLYYSRNPTNQKIKKEVKPPRSIENCTTLKTHRTYSTRVRAFTLAKAAALALAVVAAARHEEKVARGDRFSRTDRWGLFSVRAAACAHTHTQVRAICKSSRARRRKSERACRGTFPGHICALACGLKERKLE